MSIRKKRKELMKIKLQIRKKLTPLYSIFPLDYSIPQSSLALDSFIMEALLNGDEKLRKTILEYSEAYEFKAYNNCQEYTKLCQMVNDAKARLEKTDAFVNEVLKYHAEQTKI